MAVQMHVDRDEAIEILVSVLAVALAFTFAGYGLKLEPTYFIFLLAAHMITVGSGFVLHEMAHKYYGIKYGAKARFKAWPLGLGIGLALAVIPQIFGIPVPLFIAPGAVYIYAMRHISPKENGVISLAGPATNVVLAAVFIALALVFQGNEIILSVAGIGARVNLMLAWFNMLPIFPLDGSKVLAWDWRVWLAAFAPLTLLAL